MVAGLIIPGLIMTASAQYLQQGNKLTASDYSGQPGLGVAVALSADGNTLLIGGPGNANVNLAAGAAWVFTRTGASWVQQGPKLLGPEGGLGNSVALSADGSTAIIGAPASGDKTGAAWIFTRSNGSWAVQAKLVGTGAIGQAQQGHSVAISADGNTAMSGGPADNSGVGAAWVFSRSGARWVQAGTKLVGSGAETAPYQGNVALSGDGNTAVVGGPNADGALWIFSRSQGVWAQQGEKLSAPNINGGLGSAVAISSDGNTIVAGAPYDNGIGGAWIFSQANGVWALQGTKLVGVRPALIAGNQGFAVAISSDGNTVVIGGPLGSGAAWAFTRAGTTRRQVGDPLVGTGANGAPAQGAAVAVSADGNMIAVGGPSDGLAGATWLFAKSDLPYILTNGIVNGANFLPGVAPGAWITIKGENLATSTRTWQDADFFGNNLPTELDGVQVQINGKSAYVYYISPSQLNVLAPAETTTGAVSVAVTAGALGTVEQIVTEASLSPALFTWTSGSATYTAAVRSDGAYISPGSPAKPGDIVLLYGTGFGATTPPQPIGQLVSPAPLTNQVTVSIGGYPAKTSFAGLVSPGLYQFNVVVPSVTAGDQRVYIDVGGIAMQTWPLLSIGQ